MHFGCFLVMGIGVLLGAVQVLSAGGATESDKAAVALPGSYPIEEREALLEEAMRQNPAVLAAVARLEQAARKLDELADFLDPSFFALGGRTRARQDLPLNSGFADGAENAYELQVGAEVPVFPGAYVAVGGAHRILTNRPRFDHLHQTLLGARIRIPLLQDLGFRGWSLQKSAMMAEGNAAIAALMATKQAVRRTVEAAYIQAYEKWLTWQNSREASQRFLRHYEETRKLYECRAVAEFQIHQAHLELQMGLDDEAKAETDYRLALVALGEAIGRPSPVELHATREKFLRMLSAAESLPDISPESARVCRGTLLQRQCALQETAVRQRMAEEEMRDRLDLQLGVTLQGEDPRGTWAQYELETERRLGGEALLVWRRKMDYRGARARRARYAQERQERLELLREEDNRMQTERLAAMARHAAALHRLGLMEEGISSARRSLEAAQERFREGEASSTDVTDAQKNLTALLQRQAMAGAELLTAKLEFEYAVGFASDVTELNGRR